MSKENQKKREDRFKQTAEVFTPDDLVNEVLNKMPREVWRKEKTFCDPSCGNGNFLIWILLRKIRKGHIPLDALKTIYGVDIMRDKIQECRMRLLKVVELFTAITEEHIKAVFQNIVWINQNKFPTGSLAYDFSFANKARKEDIERWMKYIYKDHSLDDVDLPVTEEQFTPTYADGEDMFADQ